MFTDLQNEINKAKNCEKEVKNITTQRKTYELYYTKDGKNWSEAQKACEEHHANLVIINSKKEEGVSHLKAYILKKIQQY